MPRRIASNAAREEGTASVELVAAVPFLLLAVLVAAQIACAGCALWSAAIAARAGARASLVGRDARLAARRALPGFIRAGATVIDQDGVKVRVTIPRILPLIPEVTVDAASDLEG